MIRMKGKELTFKAFVRKIMIEVAAAEAVGLISSQAITNHLNTNGITRYRGECWTSSMLDIFLESPDSEQNRSKSYKEQEVSLNKIQNEPSRALTSQQLQQISKRTIGHYDLEADNFRDGTNDHDVSQNYDAFLGAIKGKAPFSILDLGCGPGRDLMYFKSLSHRAVGLDGSKEFVTMAASFSGCHVLHQEFLKMTLPDNQFDGVFANASLFHVPSQELPRILLEISATLKSNGVLFCSNPRGKNEEGFSDSRYSCFHDLVAWQDYLTSAGFIEIEHYYRPKGLPCHKQPWLATVWRKTKQLG